MHTKNQFIQILHGYLRSTEDDARQIQALKETFPYSQVLHALSARLSKDHNLPTEKEDLQQAAVHATDRSVLKDIMTRDHAWPVSHEVAGQTHPEAPPSISASTPAPVHEEENTVAEGVMNELNRLSELRHNFESMFEAEAPSANVTSGAASDATPVATPPEPEPVMKKTTDQIQDEAPAPAKKPKGRVGRKPGRAKAQRIIDLAKALEKQAGSAPETSNPPKKKAQKKNASGPDDLILNDIEHSKKKLGPETGKQQEQLEIIDQFINAQPRIPNLKDKAGVLSTADLSTMKTGEFGDHLVSETLVEILVNQGKKERAIEVLKKLIWKFPQKKAYFAAQIEELRK